MDAEKKPSLRKKIIISGIAGIVFCIASYFIYQSYTYVSTDNAMILGAATLLSPKVGGIIIKAEVQENEKVKSGQVLVELQPGDYHNALVQAEAELESIAAQLKGVESNYKRTNSLFEKGASTQERLDTAESQYRALQRKLKSAEAQVAQAKLNLSYTKVVAPTDGTVGKKSFELGMLAAPGQPLLGFVEGKDRWVVANLKETDMELIVVGIPAFVQVDAIPGKTFQGAVESISPATGATFSLLPPDNATGNFTKVVQRVPVRIKLFHLNESDVDRLQSGLSADVKIKIR